MPPVAGANAPFVRTRINGSPREAIASVKADASATDEAPFGRHHASTPTPASWRVRVSTMSDFNAVDCSIDKIRTFGQRRHSCNEAKPLIYRRKPLILTARALNGEPGRRAKGDCVIYCGPHATRSFAIKIAAHRVLAR